MEQLITLATDFIVRGIALLYNSGMTREQLKEKVQAELDRIDRQEAEDAAAERKVFE